MSEQSISMAEVLRNELALLQCWPALESVWDGAWVARFGRGYTGRANSVQCLDIKDGDRVSSRLNEAVRLYQEHGITPKVRVTPLIAPELEAEMARRDWLAQDHTHVMTYALGNEKLFEEMGGPKITGSAIECYSVRSLDWQKAMVALLALNQDSADSFGELVRRMPDLANGYLVRSEGKIVAGVIANIHEGIGNVFSLQVDPLARRKGVARALMGKVLAWMRSHSVQSCALQVVQFNVSALALYRSIGFKNAYTYHYCVPHTLT